ncbi:hypothetical protein PENTCL1PPCAC_19405, partial [Pristionchus entomophagus]
KVSSCLSPLPPSSCTLSSVAISSRPSTGRSEPSPPRLPTQRLRLCGHSERTRIRSNTWTIWTTCTKSRWAWTAKLSWMRRGRDWRRKTSSIVCGWRTECEWPSHSSHTPRTRLRMRPDSSSCSE